MKKKNSRIDNLKDLVRNFIYVVKGLIFSEPRNLIENHFHGIIQKLFNLINSLMYFMYCLGDQIYNYYFDSIFISM